MPVPARSRRVQERQQLHDEAYEQILGAIVDGTFLPGERLRDDDLTEWLGVSRTPIRLALSRLAETGLIEMARGSYTRVALVDVAEVQAHSRILAELIHSALLTVVPRLTTKDLRRLSSICSNVKRANRAADPMMVAFHLEEFILEIGRLEGNPVRQSLFEWHCTRLRAVATTVDFQKADGAIKEHADDLLLALKNRDARKAAQLTRRFYTSKVPELVATSRFPSSSADSS